MRFLTEVTYCLRIMTSMLLIVGQNRKVQSGKINATNFLNDKI